MALAEMFIGQAERVEVLWRVVLTKNATRLIRRPPGATSGSVGKERSCGGA